MSSVSNINQLDRMPFKTLGLISSFNPIKDARATTLVCKHLHDARSFMEPTTPPLMRSRTLGMADAHMRHLTPGKALTLHESIPLDVLNLTLRFTRRPEQLQNQLVCTSFRQAQLIAPTALHLQNTETTDADLDAILDRRGDIYSHINISNCPKLTGKSIERLAKLQNLRSLNLSSNTFTDKDLLPLEKSNVRSLNLSYCKSLTGKDFRILRNLVRLDLTGCSNLHSIAFDLLRRCPGLIILVLANTGVSDNNIKNIIKLKNLRKLDVSKCSKITDASIILFKRLVDDGFNLVTKDCRNVHMTLKQRHEKSDFRHSIRAPLPEDTDNDPLALTSLYEWKKALQEKRIGELFKTLENLPGHVEAIRVQIRRFPRNALALEGRSGDVVTAASQTLKEVRESLVKSMESTQQKWMNGEKDSFPLPKMHTIPFPEWTGIPELVI